jgi:hypothetical protein
MLNRQLFASKQREALRQIVPFKGRLPRVTGEL